MELVLGPAQIRQGVEFARQLFVRHGIDQGHRLGTVRLCFRRPAHRRPPPARAATARPPSSPDLHVCTRYPAREMPNPGCRRNRPHGTRSTPTRPSTWPRSPASTPTPRPAPRAAEPEPARVDPTTIRSSRTQRSAAPGSTRPLRRSAKPPTAAPSGCPPGGPSQHGHRPAPRATQGARHQASSSARFDRCLEPHGRARGSPL